jgi:hypothetical protein
MSDYDPIIAGYYKVVAWIAIVAGPPFGLGIIIYGVDLAATSGKDPGPILGITILVGVVCIAACPLCIRWLRILRQR